MFYPNIVQVLEWERTLPAGNVLSTSDYCRSYESFQDSLGSKEVISIEISADSTSRVCNDPVVANKIAIAFSNCKGRSGCSQRSFSCNGQTWRVGLCSSGGEINVGNYVCKCTGGGVTVRPCVSNVNWGGSNQTCYRYSNSMTFRIAATIKPSNSGKSSSNLIELFHRFNNK